MYILIDSLYYFCYPLLLMLVVQRDSRYWQEHGSLLLDMHLAMEQDGGDELRIGAIAEVPIIPFSALVFRRKLGSGGFAEVYMALWQDANVAVKVFRVSQGQQEAMNELLKEARLMFQLDHPNVVQLLGIAMRGRRLQQPIQQQREEDLKLLINDEQQAREEDLLSLSDHDVMLCLVMKV